MTQKKIEKTCFLISPIGKDGSPTRIRSNKFQKYVVEKVLNPRGYKVERADQLGEPGLITNQIVKRIVECDLLVADLTDQNANVFYELAIRHGIKKPFIHFIAHDQNIPFDNLNVRAISVDLTDLDSVEDACQQFLVQVESIESPTHTPESPISVAFDLENLRNSGKTDEAIMVQLFDQISMIRHDMRRIERDRDRPIRTRPSQPIVDSGSLIQALRHSRHSDLAEYITSHITINKVDYPDVIISPDSGVSATDISDSLSDALREITRRPWNVEFLPF